MLGATPTTPEGPTRASASATGCPCATASSGNVSSIGITPSPAGRRPFPTIACRRLRTSPRASRLRRVRALLHRS
eukprot:2930815-Prymnesium_polylepis.1